MSDMGIVRAVSIGEGYRSGKQVVLIDVEIDDPRDVQSLEYLFPSGECSLPNEGDTVLIHEVSHEYKVATASNTGVLESSLSNGEKSLFAVKDGDIKAKLTFLNSGELVLNDGDDYAVQFTALKTGFDMLKTELNALVTIFNSHFHPVAALPNPIVPPVFIPTSVTATPGAPSVASIDSSKIEKVRV